jgi:L-ribulose-5-phosphate 4-epimerase
MIEQLRDEVFQANIALRRYGLVTLTWGNVSGINRTRDVVAIKPSGVDYESMTPADMVVVDLDGNVLDGKLRPSSDTPTHLELYRAFPSIGGVVHTHSAYATMFAQACREIPCLGTTHADHFNGPIPVTRFLSAEEVEAGYERETGKVIVERFSDLHAEDTPGVLVAGHAPFAWGKNGPWIPAAESGYIGPACAYSAKTLSTKTRARGLLRPEKALRNICHAKHP